MISLLTLSHTFHFIIMPTGRRPDGQSGGRIHVHSRNTDDMAPIIGANLTIQEAHTSAITMMTM